MQSNRISVWRSLKTSSKLGVPRFGDLSGVILAPVMVVYKSCIQILMSNGCLDEYRATPAYNVNHNCNPARFSIFLVGIALALCAPSKSIYILVWGGPPKSSPVVKIQLISPGHVLHTHTSPSGTVFRHLANGAE